MKVKVLISQSCPALCDPKDWSLPDSSIPGILQAILQPRSGLPFPSAGDFPDPALTHNKMKLNISNKKRNLKHPHMIGN